MRVPAALALSLALAALVGGCASGSKVTLLTDEGSAGVGAVAVLDAKSKAEVGALTRANTQASVGGSAVRAKPVDPSNYAPLLAGLPPPPQRFTLYFVEGTTNLTEESKPTFDTLRTLVTPGSYVQIVGYTDTVGGDAENQLLSERRAAEIKGALVKLGLPVADAQTTGRGEHDLAKATADNVAEPANRRVEIILR